VGVCVNRIGTEYTIRHRSLHTYSLANLPDESDYYKNDKHFSSFGAGKCAAYLAIKYTLFRNGFFENKGREHGSYVSNYLLRPEVVADAWIRAKLGPICTAPSYVYQENDIVDAYYCTIGILIRNRIPFKSIERFVIDTLNPIDLLNRFEYDILVTRDPKTFLQEYMQATIGKTTSYEVESEEGRPDHMPIFAAQVRVPRIGVVRERGRSKHEATVLAAESALQRRGAPT
jgi:dsRNA-specific ribonuclease